MTRDQMEPIWTQHPLWLLRRRSLIAIAIGVVLNVLALVGLSSGYSYFLDLLQISFSAVLLEFIDSLFILWDLVYYTRGRVAVLQKAFTKKEHANLRQTTDTVAYEAVERDAQDEPDYNDEPEAKFEWPDRRTMILDLVFFVSFLGLFWSAFVRSFGGAQHYGPAGEGFIFMVYGNIPALFLLGLHWKAFWRQLVRKPAPQSILLGSIILIRPAGLRWLLNGNSGTRNKDIRHVDGVGCQTVVINYRLIAHTRIQMLTASLLGRSIHAGCLHSQFSGSKVIWAKGSRGKY
jgi:hypothetical protein